MKLSRKGKTPMKGKHHTEEAKKRISEANTGKIRNQEQRNKISISNTGKKRPYMIERNRIEKKGKSFEELYGKERALEIREKISENSRWRKND